MSKRTGLSESLTTERRLGDIIHVSEIVGLAPRTISRLVRAEQFPAPVRIGGSLRWDLQALERWIDEGCAPLGSMGPGGATSRRDT